MTRPYLGDEQAHTSCLGGSVRKLDRDYWNRDLFVRNFFISHAPVNNMTYPQTSSPCISGDRSRVMHDDEQDQQSKKYWVQNLAPERICPPQGLPLQTHVLGMEMNKTALPEPKSVTKMCKGDDWSRIPGTQDRSDLAPWVSGINKNIDAESSLQRRGFNNNADCYPNPMCWTSAESGKERTCQMFRKYFQDKQCVYPNYTPKLFNNFTRAKYNYSPDHDQ